MTLNYVVCFVSLMIYREFVNIQLLYFCGVMTIVFHIFYLIFLLGSSKRKMYIKASIFNVLWGMGFLAVVGATLIYFDVSFINRGKVYGVNIFYPLMQTSLLQGFASLVLLLIYLIFKKFFTNK